MGLNYEIVGMGISIMMLWKSLVVIRLLLLPHPFPLLYGVDVSYETPPLNSVFSFLP